ncbi:MAG: hypothetical protein U1A27_04240 [Phycisphaerae bacterium]
MHTPRPPSAWGCLACLALTGAVAGQSRPEPSTSRPATTQPADRRQLEAAARWVSELGAPEFARRQAAAEKLADMGDVILPVLLPRLEDPDPEIAQAVIGLLPEPRDGAARADVAIRLLRTGRRDALRRAVGMIFADPGRVIEPLMRRAADETGRTAAMLTAICEQLERWRGEERRYEQARATTRPVASDSLARLEKLHAESPGIHAEVAFWMALAARDEFVAAQEAPRNGATSRP